MLPAFAFAELIAVLLFGFNLAMSLATPIPAWFERRYVNERMTIYWLISSYPASRRLLVQHGLKTLTSAEVVPKTLSRLKPRRLTACLRQSRKRSWAISLSTALHDRFGKGRSDRGYERSQNRERT